MSKVYIPIVPLRRNRATGKLENVFDFSPAERYGDLTVCVGSQTKPQDRSLVRELSWALSSFGPDDYLLCVGNPIIIGLSFALVARRLGSIQCLQWSNGDYTVINHEVFPDVTG